MYSMELVYESVCSVCDRDINMLSVCTSKSICVFECVCVNNYRVKPFYNVIIKFKFKYLITLYNLYNNYY